MSIKAENLTRVRTYTASEDLSSAARFLTKPGSADGEIAKATASGALTFGVVVEAGASGKPVGVCDMGDLYVESEDGSYSYGQELTASANGKVTAASAGDYVCAISLETATLTSDKLHVRLTSAYKK